MRCKWCREVPCICDRYNHNVNFNFNVSEEVRAELERWERECGRVARPEVDEGEKEK